MKYAGTAILIACLSFTSGCALYGTHDPAAPHVAQPKELSVPVGKQWKVVEEAPALQNERNDRKPFQTEQSLQPEGVQRPAATEKGRTIETPR
ncbi:lipoprotein, putative [Citrifermentans bemidjiense Bem]|uniref:Lipoprotein, putative n=1 Tax=Citrifermentans bemidjiense (strain ATCC BAA-1014 / DSM 16622 / JCM 12645 / Bem) TaxID=404380 RepID=B5EE80_CITBB|nr:hypothetical protein [Citrifermentans bemidjiense]ACH39225.1 lipoprotein, putative [Citrifermentans bemidjiense Bem]